MSSVYDLIEACGFPIHEDDQFRYEWDFTDNRVAGGASARIFFYLFHLSILEVFDIEDEWEQRSAIRRIKSDPRFTSFQISMCYVSKEKKDYILRTGPCYYLNFQRFKCNGLAPHVTSALLAEEEMHTEKSNLLLEERLQLLTNPLVELPQHGDYEDYCRYFMQMRSAVADACPGLVSTKEGTRTVEVDSYTERVPRDNLPHAILFADLVQNTLSGYDRLCRQVESY